MRDENQRAGKFEQAFFQNFEGGNIEVVGRLVEQKQIRRLQHELSDQDAGALAAGKTVRRADSDFRGSKRNFAAHAAT